MLDDLLSVIKQIAVDVNAAGKPVAVLFGTVAGDSPLKIRLNQKITLGKNQLILTRNVTDYTVKMEFNHSTESAAGGSGDDSFAEHRHEYRGPKEFTVKNGLKTGEKVLLIQMQEGQRFVVVDRVVSV